MKKASVEKGALFILKNEPGSLLEPTNLSNERKRKVMKNNIKQFLSILLAMALLITGFLPGAVYAADTAQEGKTYKVKIDKIEHVKIETENESYSPGQKVFLEVKVEENYVLESLEATDQDGKEVGIGKAGEIRSFLMPESDVTITGTSIFQEPETQVETETETGPETETKITETAQAEEKESETELKNESFITPGSRSANDYQDYVTFRANGTSNISQGMTVTNGTLKIPSEYSGAIGLRTGSDVAANLYDTLEDNDMMYVTVDNSYKYNGSSAGKVCATYPRNGYYNGEWIDVKVTALDWDVSDRAINSGQGVRLRFSSYPGIMNRGANWVEIKYEFFKAGTTTPVSMKGYSSWQDVDLQQGIVLKNGFKRTKETIFVSSVALGWFGYNTVNTNPYIYAMNTDNFPDLELDARGMVTALFEGSSLTLTYTFIRDSGLTSGGIACVAEKLFKGPIAIKKKVSDSNEKLVTENTLNESPDPRKEKFSYTIETTTAYEMASNYYRTYSIYDEIDDGLTIDSTNIKIVNESGADCTSWFDRSVQDGNKLLISAKSTYLNNATFYNRVFTTTVPVTIKDSTDLKSDKYWDDAKRMAKINNTASLTCDAIDAGTLDSNKVITYVPLYTVPDNSLTLVKTEDGTGIPLSEVTFDVYEWNGTGYNTTAYDTLSDERETGTYLNTIPYLYTPTNQGKFKVVETQSAVDHFNPGWEAELNYYDGTAAEVITFNVNNVKIEPKLSVAKSFDKTTCVELVDGRYQGDRVSGWYDFNDDIKVTLTVRNYGNIDITNLVLSEEPSEALKAVLVDGTGSYVIPEGGNITTEKGEEITVTVDKNNTNKLHISELKMGDSFQIEYAAKIIDVDKTMTELEDLENVVKITGEYDNGRDEKTPVPEDEDDTDTDSLNVYNPIVEIEKVDAKGEGDSDTGYWYTADDQITYHITVSNKGNTPLYQSVVKDIMSEELLKAVVSGSAKFDVGKEIKTSLGKTANITVNGNTSITIDEIGVGDSVTVKFAVTVSDWETVKQLADTQGLKNKVTVTPGYEDPENPTPADPDDSEVPVSIYKPLISVKKIADKTTVTDDGDKISGWYCYEDTVNYTITVSNDGNTDVFDLYVIDAIPEELAAALVKDSARFVIDGSGTVTTAKGNKVTIIQNSAKEVVLDKLAAGDSVTLEFTAEIADREAIKDVENLEELANMVKVIGTYDKDDEPTPVPEDEDDTDKEVINVYNPLMSVTKEADKEYYDLGDTATYKITVDNYGNTSIYNISIVDTLSKELKALVKDGKASFKVSNRVLTEKGEEVIVTKTDDLSIILNELKAGDNVSLTVKVILADSVTDNTNLVKLENTVKITGEYGNEDNRVPVDTDEDDEDSAIINAYQGFVEIIKISSGTKKKLKDAEFDIVDADNKVIGRLKTNAKGYAKSAALPSGKYYVIETKAPEGFVLNKTKYKFELDITKPGQKITLTISNNQESKETETKSTSQPKTEDSTAIIQYILLALSTLAISIMALFKRNAKKCTKF